MPHPSRRTALGTALGTVLGLSASGLSAHTSEANARQKPAFNIEVINADAPYPESHASSVVETRTGALIATWFGGTKERNPDVGIWVARRGSDGWLPATEVANGLQADGTRQPTWNPVLFQAPQGPLILFYKIGPSPQEWWGMTMVSEDDGHSWSAPQRLPDGVLGPIKNKPVVLPDGTWLSPSSHEGAEGVGAGVNVSWGLHFERSEDQGRTWSVTPPVASPAGIDAIQPSLLLHADGRLQAVARARQGALASSWSSDGGRTWSGLTALELPNPNSGTDAVTLSDGRHLIVYNHSGHMPDRPGKGLRYPLNVALSDDGLIWRNVLTLESEPCVSGYAYPAVIQGRDGRIHITYTADRKAIRYVVLDPLQL